MKVSGTKFRLSMLTLMLGQLSLSACRHQGGSDPKVTGGKEDLDFLPTTVGLSTVGDPTAPFCTAGFISDRLLITAGHCIPSFDYADLTPDFTIVSNAESFKGKTVGGRPLHVHPEYNILDSIESWSNDLAFVLFPPGTAAKEMIMPIAQVAPKVGDEVQVVGWGFNHLERGSIVNKRHHGRNKISEIDSQLKDLIIFSGPGKSDNADDFNRVSLAKGDSGGPLYNAGSELIGIASSILLTSKKGTVSKFANVTHPTNRKYIDDTLNAFATDPATRREKQESFVPDCRLGKSSTGNSTVQYEKRDEKQGYIKVIGGDGFLCQVDIEKTQNKYMPSCIAACSAVAQTEEIFGYCKDTAGFVCNNVKKVK